MDTIPTSQIWDYYDPEEHSKMDKEVLEILKKYEENEMIHRENPSWGDLRLVLHAVAKCDPKLLDPKFDAPLPHTLRTTLRDAWKAGSFKSVRILCSLQVPKIEPIKSQLEALREAMTHQPFKGKSVDEFIRYLERNNSAYGLPGREYCGKFCSITQSSGAGKTRLLLELGKTDICVLYMNIRSKDDKGYPPRDDIPANFLTQTELLTEEEYGLRCQVFFATVFKCLGAFFGKEKPFGVLSDVDDKKRIGFFEDIKREFDDVEREILQSSSDILKGYLEAMNRAKCFSQNNADWPRVVIALDESHVLHEKLKGQKYLMATVLLRTIKSFSGSEAVWVVFASTMPKVADLTSPRALLPSARVIIQEELLFAPFTQLGWDQCTPVLEEVELDKVSWGSHLIRYGRPLWWSLRHARVEDIVELAGQKLCASPTFEPDNKHHAFAVLGQRFGLDIAFGHREAVRYNDSFIASHLRICIKTTDDRLWSYTTYPSEPIVSAAAAKMLYKKEGNLSVALGKVSRLANDGLINIGDSGELASRFLWLLAKDLCARQYPGLISPPPSVSGMVRRDLELLYCRPVPVVKFLEVVFGLKVTEQVPNIKTIFEDAYINFSHWVQMEYNITRGTDGEDDVSIEEWTESLWARTSAIQCCHNQPAVDKVIPMYFKSRPRGSAMSHILIQDKARDRQGRKILQKIKRKHKNVAPQYSTDLPYIAILADLGVKEASSLLVYDDIRVTDDPCLRIYAAGLNTTTYPFLEEDVAQRLRDLYTRQVAPPAPDYLKGLEDQVQFGFSRKKSHLDLKK